MQTDVFSNFVEYLAGLLSPFGLEALAPFIATVPLVVIFYILYVLIIRAVKSSFRKVGMPQEATSGSIFIIRLVFLAVVMVIVLTLASPILEGEVIITAGALLGTALGLAFSRSLSNLVGGLYILGARPFRVGDYIKTADEEGIVLEVTLNYTNLLLQDYSRVMVPNVRILESKITNFRTSVEDYLAERKHDPCFSSIMEIEKESRLPHLEELFRGKEFYHYTFHVVVPQKFETKTVFSHFESTCKKWAEKFLEEPYFVFWGSNNWGNQTFRFGISVSNPHELYSNGTAFQAEINDIPTN